MSRYSRLSNSSAAFSSMLERFGVVTVMNAKVYNIDDTFSFESHNADQIIDHYLTLDYICKLDTLKVANASQEGPTKTVTGGQYANPLIKYGKTARLEMQDALGNAEAIEALCGGRVEYNVSPQGASPATLKDARIALHVGSDFASTKLIIGDSFFIDQKTGEQVKVNIIFYQFLPDSLFNLTQDAEGDATVFDMNGDLLTTTILVGNLEGDEVPHGEFYSIVEARSNTPAPTGLYTLSGGGDSALVVTAAADHTVKIDGGEAAASGNIAVGQAARVQILDSANKVVLDIVLKNY